MSTNTITNAKPHLRINDLKKLIPSLRLMTQRKVKNRPDYLRVVSYGNRISITGCNLDQLIRIEIPDTSGGLPMEKFITFDNFNIATRGMPAQSGVHFGRDGLTIGSSFYGWDEDPEDYPESCDGLRDEDTPESFSLDWTAISKVLHAASDDPTRYIMNGVCIDTKDAVPFAVATDGKRLMTHSLGRTDIEHGLSLILPSAFCDAMSKCCSSLDIDRYITFQYGKRSAAFVFNKGETEITIRTRLIEGNYPNWRQILPKQGEYDIAWELNHADTPDVVRFLKAGESLGKGKKGSKRVSTKLMFKDDALTIFHETTDKESRHRVGPYLGVEGHILLNPALLAEMLPHCDTVLVRASPDSWVEQGVYCSTDPAVGLVGSHGIYLLMPLRC